MTIEDQIKDEKLQYDINREAEKYQLYHQVKLIHANTLLVKTHCHRTNDKLLNKPNLLILLWEKLLKKR